MSAHPTMSVLPSRALIALGGADWRDFLQGLVTQDVDTLADGEIRYGALLTPQGRLLYDLFLVGRGDGALIDCAAEHRDALIQRLTIYRLRAKVTIVADDTPVTALWDAASAPAGWLADPRLAALGWRGYGAAAPDDSARADEADYEVHRLSIGAPGPADFGTDASYPIEADFDLLNGIDFKKGCFVGQETTSRMKRRGTIKTRMLPIVFDGAPPPAGAELLAGELRVGEALSGIDGRALALLRLDRLDAGPLTLPDGRSFRAEIPDWVAPALAAATTAS